MENELEKTSKLKFLLESIVKIVANGQHPVLGIGANLYFDYQNVLQYNNVVAQRILSVAGGCVKLS